MTTSPLGSIKKKKSVRRKIVHRKVYAPNALSNHTPKKSLLNSSFKDNTYNKI